MAARLKKGDLVVVISGKYKTQQGKVVSYNAEDNKVVVEGINVVKRHMKPTARNQQGGIVEKTLPLNASKVMPVDPKTGKGTRVRITKDEKGNAVRVAVKSGEKLPTVSVTREKSARA
jgi:large subunit ribosomal protein L24